MREFQGSTGSAAWARSEVASVRDLQVARTRAPGQSLVCASRSRAAPGSQAVASCWASAGSGFRRRRRSFPCGGSLQRQLRPVTPIFGSGSRGEVPGATSRLTLPSSGRAKSRRLLRWLYHPLVPPAFVPPLMANVRQHQMHNSLPISPIDKITTIELTVDQAPLLQRFFDENSAYFLATSGEPAGPHEGLEEITSQVPSEMSFTKKWVIGYLGLDGRLIAMANVITDLLAHSIYHIGTFIVATDLHGSGVAQVLHRGLESWALENGASWLRLGVVHGNTRAERFWSSQGYIPVRERPGIKMGARVVTVRNMIKPLLAGSLNEYLALAPRDRAEHKDAA